MIKYGSPEWVEAFMKNVNESKAYAEAAKTWEGDFVFVTTPDGNLKDEIRIYCDLWHGKCRDAYLVTPERPAPEKVEYIFAGKYSNWLKVFDGSLQPLKGVMMRKFKVDCSPKAMAKMMRAIKASLELVNCTKIDGVEYP